MNEPRVLAWVSGGAASIVAAKLAIRLYGIHRVELVRCETANEDPDNHRFEREASVWLGKDITLLRSDRYDSVWDVWQQRRFMAGPSGAPCTMFMKVEPRLAYQRPDDLHIFGYTADGRDRKRFETLRQNYFELKVRAPLIESGITKAATLAMIQSAGIALPRSYAMGFPNANCLGTGCVKATSPGYWSLYRHHFPDRFERTATYSRELGKRLVQIGGRRRFLDELPPDWPTLKPVAPACDFLCQHAEREMEGPTREIPELALRHPICPSSPEGMARLRTMLNIDGLVPEPDRSWEDERTVNIAVARRPDARTQCGHCGSSAIAPNGTRRVTYADMPVREKATRIEWDRQRFLCQDCGRSFSDAHDALHPVRQMTRRLVDWIGDRSVDRTFADVAEDVGLSERAVSAVFREWAERRFGGMDFVTPRILGLDEVDLLGKPRLVLVNRGMNTIVDMHGKHTGEEIAAALWNLHDRDRVRVVSIGMNALHRRAARAVLPKAMIVVDRVRVLTEIDRHVEAIRKSLREGLPPWLRRRLSGDRHLMLMPRSDLDPEDLAALEGWATEFPDFRDIWQAKERCGSIWDSATEADARAIYDEWKGNLSPLAREAFRPLMDRIDRWQAEIFAAFRVPGATASAETAAALVRIANRAARGYAFDALKVKVMLNRRAWVRRDGAEEDGSAVMPAGRSRELCFGIHVPTLERVLGSSPQSRAAW